MRRSIAAALDPLAVVFRVEVTDTEDPLEWTSRRVRINVGDKTNERCVAFEDHIELAKLVALHAVRLFWILLVPIHVLADPFNHLAALSKITKPVLSMSRAQRGVVFVDEGLKDAFDMCLDRRAISSAIVLSSRGQGQRAKGKEKKSEASE